MVPVDHGGGRQGRFHVHPHIERRVEAEGESALRGVELMGGNAQVGQDTVHRVPPEIACRLLPGVQEHIIVDESEIIVNQRKTRIIRDVGAGVRVAVEGKQAPFV